MLSSPPPLSSNAQQLLQRPFTTTTVSGDPPQLSFASSPPPPAPPPPAAAYNPSLLIIAAILVFVVLFSSAIHLLLRLLSHPSSSSSSSSSSTTSSSSSFSSPSPPLIYHNSTPPPPSSSDMEPRTLSVDSLPLLSLAVVTATKSFSPDCAVCLSRFRPGDQLRLLPACRHVFHSPCIEAWLLSPASSCPLCRAPISIPSPPMPPPSPPPPPQPPEDAGTSVAPPGDEVAEAAGGDGRGWLKDYVDRLASSASSSFSSFRFSGRWSRRFDDAGEASLDLEDGGDSGTASCRWTLRTGAAS